MSGPKRMLWTLGMVFLVAFLTQVVGAGASIFKFDVSTWQACINAGVMAVLAFLINFCAPWIKQYGYKGEGADARAVDRGPRPAGT